MPTDIALECKAAQTTLNHLRKDGWSVAVHNDYRLHGEPHTFWLFTKGDRAAKGEGRTDAEALHEAWIAACTDELEIERFKTSTERNTTAAKLNELYAAVKAACWLWRFSEHEGMRWSDETARNEVMKALCRAFDTSISLFRRKPEPPAEHPDTVALRTIIAFGTPHEDPCCTCGVCVAIVDAQQRLQKRGG